MAAAAEAYSVPMAQPRPTQIQMTLNAPRDVHNLSTLGAGLNALVKQVRGVLYTGLQ